MHFFSLSMSVFFLLFCKIGFSSVYLYNDTPFPLKGVVLSATGIKMGEKQLSPQQVAYVEDQIGSSDPVGDSQSVHSFKNYNNSLTPYQVFWYCPEGDLYATCTTVSAGATVMASSCSGPSYCKPPKEKQPESSDDYKEE